ncbi:UDP-4-amino-4,6-dideoxy-N-acetyl-beta-L-altrosamine transaminase [Desulforamulus ruminis]|uniref:UDP-4-amino-4, 6-dideoxy-N-acetyl-beta-L-altrosamine transaminase n=1 Tax=Desulforamulus ruminis TaxID=1564 RepID=UPI002FDAB539
MLNIPYGKHSLNDDDIQAVIHVLKSDWLTQGPTIEVFEKRVAEYCGAKYAVAVSSATAALHISCLAAGLGEGDILWTSPNTFVASANCGLYCGAEVDFVDIDRNTYNLSINALEQKLKKAAKEKLPKVIIPVHFAGQSCEMEKIKQLVDFYNITIIEDASHAIGAEYKGEKIGSCSFSDMTVFSFHPVKIITSGEGGMILTNREDLYKKLIRLRTHGVTRNPDLMKGKSHGPWYYQQVDLGFNFRMTDIQAALGASQMLKIDKFIEKRHHLAERYNHLLQGLEIKLPWQQPNTYSAYHLYVIRLCLNKINKTRREVFEQMRKAGINVNVHYIPVHTQPYYQQRGFKVGDYPESEKYYEEAITLPIYYNLAELEQDYIVKVLKEVLQ